MTISKGILLWFILVVCPFVGVQPADGKLCIKANDSLLNALDSLIMLDDYFVSIKEKRIEQLKRQRASTSDRKELYSINQQLYQEYRTYNADSAIVFANLNQAIALQLHDADKLAEAQIELSFAYTANGLLAEALKAVSDICPEELTRHLRSQYFGQMSTLYSRLRDYSSDNPQLFNQYNTLQKNYQDSIFHTATPDETRYWNCRVWRFLGTPQIEQVKQVLESHKKLYTPNSRKYAITTFNLAAIYREEGNEKKYLENIILSAMADIRSVNGDAGSLQSVAEYLFQYGDIDRAYTYITYCSQKAMAFHNRVRVIKLSELQSHIHSAYVEQERFLQQQLRYMLIAVTILLLILCYLLFINRNQNNKLKQANYRLDEANQTQQSNMQTLEQAYQEVELTNSQLLTLNTELAKVNAQLKEANRIKEDYIGYVFTLCSLYINKIEEFRKNMSRKLKVGQIEDVNKLVNSNTMTNNAQKAFYASFDAVFLNLFPTFVTDFNALLRPEEQIIVKPGELNTELRIQALIRLGITDSNKIAQLLQCSLQTIYNNRSRTCNKTKMTKDEFLQAVRKLGQKD